MLLALPALRADDKPKDEKQPPKEQFQSLVKDFRADQQKIINEYQKLKGQEQQKKLQEYFALGSKYADKFLKIGEDNPKDPTAVDALFWVVQNGGNSPAVAKAIEKIKPVVVEMPFGDLANRLKTVRIGNPEIVEAVFKRAEDNSKDPNAFALFLWVTQNSNNSVRSKAVKQVATLIEQTPLKALASQLRSTFNVDDKIMESVLKRLQKEEKSSTVGDLLFWIAQNGYYRPIGAKALGMIAENYADHAGIENICQLFGRNKSPEAVEPLAKIVEKAEKPLVKAVATLSLGQALAGKVDTLGDNLSEAEKVAAEAERTLNMVIEKYSAEFATVKPMAEAELKALHFNRVGLTTPEISAGDLDKKDFKLSDYRGKVVLLDFWGNW